MKKIFLRFGLLVPLIILWIFFRQVYRDRIPAFGCFDDCFNYMGGYFLLSGKRLFSEIFFNHQPIPAYISAAIQFFTKPEGIYLLIYQHRMFIIYLSIIADALLVLRFGLIGFGFALLYESTKGYLFGEHFLAEAMIVYPLVYLLGMIGDSWKKKKISPIELILAAIFTWFVVFSREPYVPLAIVMFGYLLWKCRGMWSRISLGLFGLLSFVTIALHSLPDYFFNVVTVNASRPGSEGTMWSVIFYPVLVFFGGTWNMFRIVEVSLALLFWILVLALIKKKLFYIVALFIFLTLANIRATAPGEIYYAAFHHIVWYGMFIMSILLLLGHTHGVFSKIATIAFFGITVWALFNPQSYLHEKVDRHAELITNYDVIFVNGGIVKTLSSPEDSLFLDGWDDLIYFEAKRYSPYKYSWLTSAMPQFEKFRRARDEMFAKTPPTFFYGRCSSGVLSDATIRTKELKEYIQLFPSCVFIHPSKLSEITEDQWKQVQEKFGIIKPTNVETL